MGILWEILRQSISGHHFQPEFGESKTFKQWISVLDHKICGECKARNGEIYPFDFEHPSPPPIHLLCRCKILPMPAIKAGTATIRGTEGADWIVKYTGELPEYYVTKQEALAAGWNSKKGNLSDILPGKMLGGDAFLNTKARLPVAIGRVWYEADINYDSGYRNECRILYSNDGLVFVTYDHYDTFYEII